MPADVNLNIDISKKGSGDKEAAAGLEVVAKAADDAKDELAKLDRKLLETRAAMVAAGKTFSETGDISPLKSLIKDERQLATVQKAISRGAEAIAKDMAKIPGIGGGAQGGLLNFAIDEWVAKLASSTKRGIQSGFDSLSGSAPTGLRQWLVAGGVAAAPALLAAIDGALLAGVGSIGIGAAIIGQIKDPAVAGAFKSLGHEIETDLTASSTSFREPLIRAALDFSAAWKSIQPGLKQSFEALAPAFSSLTTGVSGLVTHLMPGFNDALKASVPILDMLGAELPHLGDAFSSFFSSVAAGGKGGKEGLQDTLVAVEELIRATGKLVEVGSHAYDLFRNSPFAGLAIQLLAAQGATTKTSKTLEELNTEGNKAANVLANVGDSAKRAGLGAQLSAGDFKNFSSAINATRQDSDALAASMVNKLVGGMLSADQASNGFDKSLITLGDTLSRNGGQLSEHVKALKKTETGAMQNKDAIFGVIQANLSVYDSMIKVGFSAEDAAAKYDENTKALEDQMRAAGMTQAQIDGLIGKYRGVPKNVDTDIVLHGLAEAISGLDQTLRRIYGLDGKTANAYVVTHFSTTGTPPIVSSNSNAVRAFAKGGVVAAASGLITNSPTVLFGERQTRREAYIPELGISDSRGLALANTAASWHGGHVVSDRAGGGWGGVGGTSGGSRGNMTVTLRHEWPDGRVLIQQLRPEIQSKGGNVQAALGR